ncbi:CRE-GCY-35 protein [Caenorhabditis remanei]|uniref:guanylate cyclase n=1 Tax=Caenorhabditis remanei TaxID=31234 RepID=E3LN51_CAERE|nr:CRE-GCY-35 protein [Caenorhabditis remanei]
MFGWIHESFRQLVTRKYGKDIWEKIVHMAKFELGTESEIAHYYNDDETLRLVNSMANVIGIPIEEIWEAYGGFLIQFTMETGWDELLRAMAPDLEGFLDSLDSLHYFIDHVVYKTKLRGPSFRCDVQADGTLLLHYYSKRSGLYPIVKGVVREVARRIYDTEVVMKVQERKQEHLDAFVTEHVVFVITQIENPNSVQQKSISSKADSQIDLSTVLFIRRRLTALRLIPPSQKKSHLEKEEEPKEGIYEISSTDFGLAFPYHICFDPDLFLEHFGNFIKKTYPNATRQETRVTDLLELVHPEVPFSYESIKYYKNSLFVFRLKGLGDIVHNPTDEAKTVLLKGSMVFIDEGKYILYMCSVNVTTVRELIERNLHLSDMQRHDGTRDVIMLNQSRMSQVELNRTLEETTKKLKKMAQELEIEKQKTDELLCELMPASVADSLRSGKTMDASQFID